MKFRAFTLTELLLALLILGLLLGLTVPSIGNHMINKNNVVALQRTYLAVFDAVKLVLQEERAKDVNSTYLYMASGESVDSSAGAFLKNNFKVVVDCGTSKNGCLADSYKTLNKSQYISLPSNNDMYCVNTASRVSVCLVPPQEGTVGKVYVDVNGLKSPNVAGKDLFLFYIYSDGFVGDRDDDADSCDSSTEAVGCFNKLSKSNWVMNY